jgi:MauM/NapG family ferredoxin protein
MTDDHLENLPPNDRRGFFRSSLSRLLGPVADYIETKLPIDRLVPLDLLRPPGAMAERDFLDTCFRCGSCADACPADAIVLFTGDGGERRGTPHIDPNRRACVICDDLSCMKVCPSGALRLVERHDIRIGLAKVNHSTCVRSNGEDCTTCVDVCPLGRTAIRIDNNGRIEVIDPNTDGKGCTGCGVCQEQCPTRPKRAIQVHPHAH